MTDCDKLIKILELLDFKCIGSVSISEYSKLYNEKMYIVLLYKTNYIKYEIFFQDILGGLGAEKELTDYKEILKSINSEFKHVLRKKKLKKLL